MQPAIALNTREWNAQGIEPAVGEEIYTAGEQPIAAHDNWWNWAVSQDLANLNGVLGDHDDQHEAGGQQQIDLHDLRVNNIVRFHGDSGTGEYWWVNPSTNSSVMRADINDNVIRQFPRFGIAPTLSKGASLGGDITHASSGNLLYDHSVQKFERAKQADEADHAITAGDSDTLDGYHASDFVHPNQQYTITAPSWSFQNIIHADISGRAETAGHASTADDATNADHATTAGDADTVDGYHASSFLQSGDVSNTSVSEDGTQVVGDAADINFASGVTASADGDGTASVVAGTSSDPVEHANNADYADNADMVDNYHAQEIINEAASQAGGQWTHLTETTHADAGTNWQWDYQTASPYDRYKIVILHENHSQTENFLNLQVGNGGTVDTRQRYNFTEFHDYTEPNKQRNEIDSTAGLDRDSWEIAQAPWNGFSVMTYHVSLPQAVSQTNNHHAVCGLAAGEFTNKAWEWFHHGILETDYPSIDTFRFRTEYGNSTGQIQLYGQQITR